ncbi:hypothetical protein [Pseudomonas glycinae]|uniref:hypothetical protein n=1 Tax=Pseudomonas glycinae TaxID=1785145 RepID=UPI0039EFC1B0
MSIGHFLGLGFVTGRQPLLKRQPLILLGLLRGGADHGQLIESFGAQPGLLGKLLAIAPVLKLPSAAKAGEDERQRAYNLPRHRHHGTSLKKTWPPR